jgi:hypothetical protein
VLCRSRHTPCNLLTLEPHLSASSQLGATYQPAKTCQRSASTQPVESLEVNINPESDESNYDGDEVISLDDDEDTEPTFCYDVDHPCVDEEGVIYPDVNAVKFALTHHAIIKDYAFQTVKKDKSRFRAKCKKADKGCKWTFFFESTSKRFYGCKACSIIYTPLCYFLFSCNNIYVLFLVVDQEQQT